MELHLGAHRFDVTHRAVVVAILRTAAEPIGDGLLRAADAATTAGADVLDAGARADADTVEALSARFDLPVCVEVTDAASASAALAAGAAAVRDARDAADLDLVAVCVAAGASLLTATMPPGDAGLPVERIVLDVDAARLHGGLARAAEGGLVCISAPDLATQAVGLVGGCRLLRATDVRAARRVATVVASLAEAAA